MIPPTVGRAATRSSQTAAAALKTELWVFVVDLHYPEYHEPTKVALFDFLSRNRVDGFIFGGDQHHNDAISHHTKHKPLFRTRRAFKNETEGFDREILTPVEQLLHKQTKKVWIKGNHERFEDDLVEEMPELDGQVNRFELLKLKERGWHFVDLGHTYRHGKLNFLHGEWLTGIGNQAGQYPARKLVEIMAGSALAGHTHSPQSFTRAARLSLARPLLRT